MARKIKLTREVEIQELKSKYQTEKDPNLKQRILMLLHVKEGKSANQTADALFVDKNTVSQWVKRFNEEGFEGLADLERPGRPRKVDYQAFKGAMDQSPQNFGYPHEVWFPKLVEKYLKEHQNIDLAPHYVYRLIKRAGYALKVPSRKSYKSDENKVILFKKNSIT